MPIWNIAAALTGERLLMKDTSGRRPSRDEMARLAYRLYEMYGRRDGYDLGPQVLDEAAPRPWIAQHGGDDDRGYRPRARFAAFDMHFLDEGADFSQFHDFDPC